MKMGVPMGGWAVAQMRNEFMNTIKNEHDRE
jgi:hypothetical protein